MPSMEEQAKRRGFDNAKEMDKLIGRINLLDPLKWEAFLEWAESGGSKADLLGLIDCDDKANSESLL